jgi:hypothetical protein
MQNAMHDSNGQMVSSINLAGVEASAFEAFLLWLYAFDHSISWESFDTIIDLAILAEQYNIYRLKNQTSDFLQAALNEHRWKATPDQVWKVYDSVPSDSILRQLCFLAFSITVGSTEVVNRFAKPYIDWERFSFTSWEPVFNKFPGLGWDYFRHIQVGQKRITNTGSNGACYFHDHSDIQGLVPKNTKTCPYPFGAPVTLVEANHVSHVEERAVPEITRFDTTELVAGSPSGKGVDDQEVDLSGLEEFSGVGGADANHLSTPSPVLEPPAEPMEVVEIIPVSEVEPVIVTELVVDTESEIEVPTFEVPTIEVPTIEAEPEIEAEPGFEAEPELEESANEIPPELVDESTTQIASELAEPTIEAESTVEADPAVGIFSWGTHRATKRQKKKGARVTFEQPPVYEDIVEAAERERIENDLESSLKSPSVEAGVAAETVDFGWEPFSMGKKSRVKRKSRRIEPDTLETVREAEVFSPEPVDYHDMARDQAVYETAPTKESPSARYMQFKDDVTEKVPGVEPEIPWRPRSMSISALTWPETEAAG